jgi:hypothetical protein
MLSTARKKLAVLGSLIVVALACSAYVAGPVSGLYFLSPRGVSRWNSHMLMHGMSIRQVENVLGKSSEEIYMFHHHLIKPYDQEVIWRSASGKEEMHVFFEDGRLVEKVYLEDGAK